MKLKTLLSFALLYVFLFPVQSLACACCAEPDFYSIWTGKPDGYYLEVLEKIEFTEAARLYVDAAGFDALKGLQGLTKNAAESDLTDFSLTDAFAAKIWKLNFKSANGKTGTLTLPLPAQMLSFKADIHDNSDEGLGPVLYKEWRFKGLVQNGTGFFQTGILKPTTYFLVFQGRGNGCDNPEDFTHWRLEINGKKANFAFTGKLSSGRPQTNENKAEK